MSRRWLAVGALWVGVFLPSCKRLPLEQRPLVRRELPGAVIHLPEGKETAASREYSGGRLNLEVRWSRTQVGINWRTGSMSSAEDLEQMLIKAMTESLEMKVTKRSEIVVGGSPGHRFILRSVKADADRVMVMSVWPCGKRFFSLTVGPVSGAPALERRIRDSFECKPDPARDGQRRGVTVQLPPTTDVGLSAEAEDNGALTFKSLGGDIVLIAPLGDHIRADDVVLDKVFPAVLTAVLEKLGVSEGRVGSKVMETGQQGSRPVWRGRGDRDGPVRLLAVFIECNPGRYLALHLGPEVQDANVGLRLLLDSQCMNNPKHPPAYAELASAACAAGDQRGCTPP